MAESRMMSAAEFTLFELLEDDDGCHAQHLSYTTVTLTASSLFIYFRYPLPHLHQPRQCVFTQQLILIIPYFAAVNAHSSTHHPLQRSASVVYPNGPSPIHPSVRPSVSLDLSLFPVSSQSATAAVAVAAVQLQFHILRD